MGSGLPRWESDPLSIFLAQGASQEEGSRGPRENASVFTICDFTFGVAEALGQSRLPALGWGAPGRYAQNVVELGLDRRAVDHPEILDPRLCGEFGGICHSSANHKRETIAFSKRRQGAMYRAAIWVVWRNDVKSRSENKKNSPPAVALGLIQKRYSIAQILENRLFPNQMALSTWLRRCYDGRISTRRLERNRVHRPALAE